MNFKGLKVHVIGIGGIGVSALARLLKAQGSIVSGSDIVSNGVTQGLEAEGILVNVPHRAGVVADKDLIIHSAIIRRDNIELQEAHYLHKQVLSRKDAIKLLLGNKKVLSICAAHGKSSTSAILASILPDFSALIGAISKEFGSNARVRDSDYLIFEADESDGSFLGSNPYVSIVLNMEAEHLENYDNDFGRLKQSYVQFINLASKSILNVECPFVREILESVRVPYVSFAPTRDITGITHVLKCSRPHLRFDLRGYGEFELHAIGLHSVINASIAIICASEFLSADRIRENLLHFAGIEKRFDILQTSSPSRPCIIDDYAHHPTEIRATLQACKIYSDLLCLAGSEDAVYSRGVDYGFFESCSLSDPRIGSLPPAAAGAVSDASRALASTYSVSHDRLPIIALWQPHKYTRLEYNLDDFVACFGMCDRLVIMPVYAAGESAIAFDFEDLFSRYDLSFAHRVRRDGEFVVLLDSEGRVIETIREGIVIGLGAGDITYQLRGKAYR